MGGGGVSEVCGPKRVVRFGFSCHPSTATTKIELRFWFGTKKIDTTTTTGLTGEVLIILEFPTERTEKIERNLLLSSLV